MRAKLINMLENLLIHLRREPFKAMPEQDIVFIGHLANQLIAFDKSSNSYYWRNLAIDMAFHQSEQSLLKAWKTSKPREVEERERIFYRMEGLAQIKLKLQGMVQAMMIEYKKREKKEKKQQDIAA